ncbi:MAG: hypothetical protein KJZ53_04010 [Anaerolineales bacterium]|nr:hypothetical protein [Anaerolineales bacterium]
MPAEINSRQAIWLGLGVGLGTGLIRDNLVLGCIAGLVAWAMATAYMRYKQVSKP